MNKNDLNHNVYIILLALFNGSPHYVG